jgi:hypothetical protein
MLTAGFQRALLAGTIFQLAAVIAMPATNTGREREPTSITSPCQP